MKNKYFLLLFICFLVLTPQAANAFYIIDTGTPPINSSSLSLRYGKPSSQIAGEFRWLAGQFYLDQITSVNSFEAYLKNSFSLDEPATLDIVSMALYSDNLNLPNLNNEIFRQSVSVSETEGGWFGPTNLNFNLTPGQYWMAVEVPNEFDFIGQMPLDAPSPLSLYAIQTETSGGEYQSFQSSLGFRLEGQTNAVPEPATMMLFGTGILGAFLRRKREEEVFFLN